MKRHLTSLLLAIVALGLGTNGFTQEKGVLGTKGLEDQRINAFMVNKIIGSKVMNLKGETLGTVEDLVVDIDTGRIVYAVLVSGGFLGIGDKLFPVPWESLAALPMEGKFFLNQSKEQLAKAPAFEKGKLPDIGDMQWGSGIFKHYGAGPAHDPGLAGYGAGYYGAGYGYYGAGYGMYPHSGERDPYGKIFDAKTIKTVAGQVIKVTQVPEVGFGMEMRLTVLSDKQEVLPVYLGPAWYVGGSGPPTRLKVGDRVTVTGSQLTRGGEPFMIAMTVKRGDELLRLRDKEGNPEWIGWKTPSK